VIVEEGQCRDLQDVPVFDGEPLETIVGDIAAQVI
jgi:hypothetical protein